MAEPSPPESPDGRQDAWLTAGGPLPSVGAVVVNWRLPQATLQCVRDLRACGYPDLQVLVVDNGSGDDSAEVLARALAAEDATSPGGRVELLPLPENVGYCAAVNRGLAWAASRRVACVLLLNNDVRLPQGFLEPLVRVLQNDPEVAGVAPTILRPDGRVWCQGARLAFAPNLCRLQGHGRPPAPPTHGPELVDYLPGACVLYREADLRRAGGLDEDYFMYVEDADLGQRLRQGGKKLLWLPWIAVTHAPSSSSGGGRSPMRKYMTALNSVRFLRAHGTPRLWAAFVLFDLLGWPLAMLRGTGPRAAWAKARGAIAGLRGRRVTVADVDGVSPLGSGGATSGSAP